MIDNDNQEIIKRNKKKRKILLLGLCVIVGIFALMGLILLISSGVINFIDSRKHKAADDLTHRTYIYPTADYSLDIFEDSYYTEQTDRNIRVTDGSVTTVINGDNYGAYPHVIQFMYDVVNHIIHGDFIEYNNIFTDDYKKKNADALRDRFTMQQLFEIELELLNTKEPEAGVIYYDVKVSYRIRNNNGTFRNDLDYNDDGSLPVVYFLVSDGSEIKAENLITHYKYTLGLY